MRKKHQALLLLFLLLYLVTFPAAPVRAEVKVLRVSDGKTIPFQEMINDLRQVSVVFVGETHDTPRHHRAQLEIISALHESGKPTAIGLEMFRANSQAALDSWVRGSLPVDRFLPVYYDNWRMPWPLYEDIFLYARERQIPMLGLNIPEGIAKKIALNGFASLSADEKKRLPPGIGCYVDPTYMEFIKRAYAAGHSHGEREFVHFCEAQMVWDKSMAWNAAGYLKDHPDRTMVVLAGIGHAWKRGIAEQLPSGANLAHRVVLPAVPDQINRETATGKDADYILLE